MNSAAAAAVCGLWRYTGIICLCLINVVARVCTAARVLTTWTATTAHAHPAFPAPTVNTPSTRATPARVWTTAGAPRCPRRSAVGASRGLPVCVARASSTGANCSRVLTTERVFSAATSLSVCVRLDGRVRTATCLVSPALMWPPAKVTTTITMIMLFVPIAAETMGAISKDGMDFLCELGTRRRWPPRERLPLSATLRFNSTLQCSHCFGYLHPHNPRTKCSRSSFLCNF